MKKLKMNTLGVFDKKIQTILFALLIYFSTIVESKTMLEELRELTKNTDQEQTISSPITNHSSKINDFDMPGMVTIVKDGRTASFNMGCQKGRDNIHGEKGNKCFQSREKPYHEVILDSFKLSETEVTVGQFKSFVEDTNYKTTAEKYGYCTAYRNEKETPIDGMSWRNPEFKQNDNHPVVCISYDDTQRYIQWLNQVDIKKPKDKVYRLPTEAEWEYSARGDKYGAYPWGNSRPSKQANCPESLCNDGYEYTAPVKSFPANAFGLYEMSGNAWEWVEDLWSENFYTISPLKNPVAPKKGDFETHHVIRGGSWISNRIHNSGRSLEGKTHTYHYLGFRVALAGKKTATISTNKNVYSESYSVIPQNCCAVYGDSNCECIVNMLDEGKSGHMVFEPAVLKANIGDKITFMPINMGHNSETEYAPQGGDWKSEEDEKFTITLKKEGVYVYKCNPHTLHAMVGVIKVGDNFNELNLKKSSEKLKNKFLVNEDRLDQYLDSIGIKLK